MLSLYDNRNILHSITFYNKNLLSVKCNYEIYIKKLLIIIKYSKYLRSKLLRTMNISIKTFTNHMFLEYFMITKKLFRC